MTLTEFIKVYDFAKFAHEGQRRKTGEPYITHPLYVADIAREFERADWQTIYACLLHDVVEDTPVKLEEIAKRFGDGVAFLVDGVTEEETPEATFDKIRRYSETDSRVIVVKMADRVHNIRTITPEIIPKYKTTTPPLIELGREHGFLNLASVLEINLKRLQKRK